VDSIINYFDKYSDLLVQLQFGFLVIIVAVLGWIWFYNRRKYQHLKHQIPASVVKSYLDSIIQNSTALKSSLFRGGGLDIDPNSIPSVMPLNTLPGGTSIDLESGGDSALKAQIAQLQAQLAQKNLLISDLENKNADLAGTVKQKQARIEELERLLAEARASSGAPIGDPDAENKIATLTSERDALKEELQQYDVISDDLANMKRLKQENEQLKKALAGAGAGVAAMAEPVVAKSMPEEEVSYDEPEVEEVVPSYEAEEEEPVMAAAEVAMPSEETSSKDDQSPEDLLSEFEKMLG
jgi:hypothetical protein